MLVLSKKKTKGACACGQGECESGETCDTGGASGADHEHSCACESGGACKNTENNIK